MSFDANNPYQPTLSTGSYGGKGPDPMAQGKVQGPAIGLIVTAILGLLWQGAVLVMNLVGIGAGAGAMPDNVPPEQAQMFEMINSVSGGIGIVGSLLGVIVGAILTFGLVTILDVAGVSLPGSGIEIKPSNVISAVLFGTIITLVSVMIPASFTPSSMRTSRAPSSSRATARVGRL